MREQFADQFRIEGHGGHVTFMVTSCHVTYPNMAMDAMSTICAMTCHMNVTFGEWLGDERRKRNMKQSELARLLGVGRSAVGNWETDVQPPNDDNLDALAALWRLPVEEVRVRAGKAPTREGGLRRAKRPDLGPEVGVKVYSRIPADAVRWMQPEGDFEPVQVPVGWLRGRSLRDVFAVEVSGDCLLSLKIMDGDVLLCEWKRDRNPIDGDLVIVRIEDEVTCKLWYWVGAQIELRDGYGNVVYQGMPSGNVHVEGFVLRSTRDYDRNPG